MKLIILDFNRTLYDPEEDLLIEGAIELLEMLQEKEVKLALVTKGGEHRVEQVAPLAVFFDHVEIVPSKSAELFTSILTRFEAAGNETMVIGDKPSSEIAAGNRVGATTVRVRQGKFATDEATNEFEQADHSFDDLFAVLDFLEREL